MISADLGKQLEAFVAGLVETGRYNSKSEVLREGVRLIQERETKLAALDASIGRDWPMRMPAAPATPLRCLIALRRNIAPFHEGRTVRGGGI